MDIEQAKRSILHAGLRPGTWYSRDVVAKLVRDTSGSMTSNDFVSALNALAREGSLEARFSGLSYEYRIPAP